jgi:ATP-dependent exoDNAse (exonuclease V) beta subunit
MEHIVKKVIMASAGTGKTYRLSLEFISLLLKYKDFEEFDFSQILVMTFTRKATAEIREKILDFLQEIADQGKDAPTIISNLEKISGYKWQSNDREYIKDKLLKEILQRKDLLQVSTIDSFTSNIFKSMIAPYLRIKDFSIDNNSNEEIMPQLLEFIFSENVFPIFQPLLKRINTRTVEGVQGFIKSLLNNRWILDYYENGSMTGYFTQASQLAAEMIEEIKDNTWNTFKNAYLDLVSTYNTLVYEPQEKAWHKHILSDYKKMIHIDLDRQIDVKSVFDYLFEQPHEIIKNINTFFTKPLPFSKTGKKVYKDISLQLEEGFIKTISALADYYIVAEILPKQQEVLIGWKSLCQHYDKLKFSLGKFTYNDITFYSYKYLYEKSLSLIDRDRGIVTNLFYEQLVSRIRFLLIDEFQDTSFNQFSILMPIINELKSGYSIKDYSGVIIVGDPKQSIYGWRGGERGIMEIMPKNLEVEAEDLNQCYRSSRPVIDMVNRIFTDNDFQEDCGKRNNEWIYHPVTAKNWDSANNCYNEAKEEGGQLYYWEYNSDLLDNKVDDEDNAEVDNKDEDESPNSYAEFAKQIKSLHQQARISWGETAILVRTHKHADQIANELNKLNIPNNIESSGKLIEHKAVELLLAVLKLRLLRDRFSLLQVLRSDLIMLDSKKLKDILILFHKQAYDINKAEEFDQLMDIPEVRKLLTITNKEYDSQAEFIRDFIANYDFSRICLNEIDWKNLYNFLDLVISFELAKLNTSVFDLFAFVEYCQKQSKNDSDILQQGLQLEDSIAILTVHKSKGLGYKNVFLYWRLSNLSAPNRGNEFKITYSFDRSNYLDLTDFIIYSSSIDEKVLSKSNSQELMQDYQERNIIEAIDVFYVALTRAEHKLGLFFAYKSKKDFTDYIASLNDQAGVIGLLVKAFKNFFIENNRENLSSDNLTYYFYNKAGVDENRKEEVTQNKAQNRNYLKDYLTDYSQANLQENRPIDNLKKVYLEDRHQLYGNVAHEFLTYIKYGKNARDNDQWQSQIKTARNMVYRRYGSLLAQDKLEMIITSSYDFVEQNANIFSAKWDKVFTEKTVFHNSQEYRIDRMMVDSKNKEIMIIDYKTGGIDDKEQVQHYIDIIKDLPFVKENNYHVTGIFLTIDLSFS